VHAYLRRKDGDPSNARYWYRRADRTPSGTALQPEWLEITPSLRSRTGGKIGSQSPLREMRCRCSSSPRPYPSRCSHPWLRRPNQLALLARPPLGRPSPSNQKRPSADPCARSNSPLAAGVPTFPLPPTPEVPLGPPTRFMMPVGSGLLRRIQCRHLPPPPTPDPRCLDV
jgi:hypothetical protein